MYVAYYKFLRVCFCQKLAKSDKKRMTRFSETHCILLYNGPSLRSFMCPLKCHKIGLAKIVR